MHCLKIIGCGPGSKAYATSEALKAVSESDVVIGAERLLKEFCPEVPGFVFRSVQETIRIIDKNYDKRIGLLVTGDPGFYSLSDKIIKRYPFKDISVIPGISSVTYGFTKLGISWSDACFLSAHNEFPGDFNAVLDRCTKIGLLTSPKITPADIAASVTLHNRENLICYVCTRLSYPDESIVRHSIDKVIDLTTDPLAVLIMIRSDRI